MMQKPWKKKAQFALLLCALASGLLAGCGQTAPKVSAVSVKTLPVQKKDVMVSKQYAGQVKALDAVSIKPKVSGTIVEKYIRSGQFVEKGQPLYKIDDRQYSTEVLSAESNVDKALTTLNNSKIDLQRYEKLAETGAISEQTLTTQRATVETNESNYRNMQSLLQKAQENLDDTIIRSPISGKLSVNEMSPGSFVTTGNTELVSVGSVNPIAVQFSISENELLNFQQAVMENRQDALPPDQMIPQATLTLSNGMRLSEVSKNYVMDREVSQSTGTITMKAIFENTEHVLLPGMFARVTIGFGTQNHVVAPDLAIVKQSGAGDRYIYVYKDGKVYYEKVELGRRMGNKYEVISGVNSGDQVVISGQSRLNNGMEVEIEK